MINIFQPSVGVDSLRNLEAVFASNWLGRGAEVASFEMKFADFLKVRVDSVHTIASCTDAIFGVFDIFGLEIGDEVIVSSVSFPAIGSAVLKSGLSLKIVDIDPDSGNINISHLLENISKRTKAIFVTHYGGIPVDVSKLRNLVGNEIFIFEDSACALGTFIDGIACGTSGDFSCWSFDAMKLLVCGEGGAMYFHDQVRVELAKEYFYLGLPSQAKSGIDRRETDDRWWEYQLNSTGRRSVFTNINAAIGLPQFESISGALLRRKQIRGLYENVLDSLGVRYIRQDDERVSYSNYFFTIIDDRRNELALFLRQRDIYSTFRYFPLHRINLFSDYALDCNNATLFLDYALNIPIHQSLSDADVVKICDALRAFFNKLSK